MKTQKIGLFVAWVVFGFAAVSTYGAAIGGGISAVFLLIGFEAIHRLQDHSPTTDDADDD